MKTRRVNFLSETGAMDEGHEGQGRTALWGVATLLLSNLLLLVPLWIRFGGVQPHLFALEAGIVTGLFLLRPRRRWTTVLALVAAFLVVVVTVLAVGDTAARMSLARPLNLYLDIQLVSAVKNLLSGTLSPFWAGVILVGGGLVAMGLVAVLGHCMGWSRAPDPIRTPTGAGGDAPRGLRLGQRVAAWLQPPTRGVGLALLVISLIAVPLRWLHPGGVVLGLPATQLVREQARQMARMLSERERFAAEMEQARVSSVRGPGLLSRLGGRDVILAFVESYGSAATDDPRYAPVVTPRLQVMDSLLAANGLNVVTGRLEAPSQGGMSWLGHGSMLSGLWLDNQLRYDLLLASDGRTLIDDFRAAGYRTVALMPAITLAWPEGERFGYDEIYAHADIDYAGPPLNWVTMPDQFTWSFLQETIRAKKDDRPLFAELGLISSHAPWTPILPVLEDWDSIGDGDVFQRWADAGEKPEDLWKDRDRVREAYARSVAYAVEVVASWAARFVDENTLLIALGDHQPAPLITGDDAVRTVPVHVIARDPALLEPFTDWGFVAGPAPDSEETALRMDAFRSWFLSAYSAPGADSLLAAGGRP